MIGVICFLVAAGLALFARRQQAKAAHQDRGVENRIRGIATVLEAGSRMSVFAARRMQPGLQPPVYVNRGDHGDFVLVW